MQTYTYACVYNKFHFDTTHVIVNPDSYADLGERPPIPADLSTFH